MYDNFFHVDTFTSVLFQGNPAAVCLLDKWLSDDIMQKIAAENNLSETAFAFKNEDFYELRWFTPKVEVDLCGHATLATAFVLFNEMENNKNQIKFKTKSGDLFVTKQGERLSMDFPMLPREKCTDFELISKGLKHKPQEIWLGVDYMAVMAHEEDIINCDPNFSVIEQLSSRGLVITAPGKKVDFVSRWFGPQVGVNEDPVTGSAHCMLAPYWALQLGKNKLLAEQISKRGRGEIHCEIKGNRILLSGRAKLYFSGKLSCLVQ